MKKLALIALLQSGQLDESTNLQEAIRRELESNPFWRGWKVDKVTVMDDVAEETITQSA